MNKSLILASKSPRRIQLLKKLKINFDIFPSNINENKKLNLLPIDFAQYWAKKKAIEVGKHKPKNLIFAADTIVAYKNNILGKPKDKNDSYRMLELLSGRTHKVITCMVFFNKEKNIFECSYKETFVTVNKLNQNDIWNYINKNNTLDKAGAYGIQGFFSVHISNINGCYYNVMGLPLSLFYEEYTKVKSLMN